MKQLILLCMFLMSIAIFSVGCEGQELKAPEKEEHTVEENKKPVVIESYFESKKPVLFEHYYMFNMYSNYQMPVLIHEKIIDLVSKAHNVSSNDFYNLYKEEYYEWYMERIKRQD